MRTGKKDPNAKDQDWYDRMDATMWSAFEEPFRTEKRKEGKEKQLKWEAMQEAKMMEQHQKAQGTQKAIATVKCKECNKKTPIEIVSPGDVSYWHLI